MIKYQSNCNSIVGKLGISDTNKKIQGVFLSIWHDLNNEYTDTPQTGSLFWYRSFVDDDESQEVILDCKFFISITMDKGVEISPIGYWCRTQLFQAGTHFMKICRWRFEIAKFRKNIFLNETEVSSPGLNLQ